MTYLESKDLSKFLSESQNSLPRVRIQQNDVKLYNKISEIICDILKTHETTIFGSRAEGLDDVDSDIDTVLFFNNSPVFNRLDFEPVESEGHPGYFQLQVSRINTELSKYTQLKDDKLYLKNNLKESSVFPNKVFKNGFDMHGPAYTVTLDQSLVQNYERKEISNKNIDVVFCFKSNKWPPQASEWVKRKRAFNWPTRELIDHIIITGYCLAPVGSKESNESEIQWRVSFNKAEQLIIESFNETQFHCIHLLRLLKKKSCLTHIARKNITSYTMKTVMFWCLEEKPEKFWDSSNLLCCFLFCVSTLKSFVEKGFLPNYFIRERNQFVAIDFTYDIQTKTRQYLETILEDSIACINLLLPPHALYRKFTKKIKKNKWYIGILCQKNVIGYWLLNQISKACAYQSRFERKLLALYDGYNIQSIIKRCNEALEKLKTVGYTQALIKSLHNFMGVLQYILLKEEKETDKRKKDSNARTKYSEHMTLSAFGDITQNTLRMATCYLDDGVKEDCIKEIKAVTESDGHFFMQTHIYHVKQKFDCVREALKYKIFSPHEIDLYNNIIKIDRNFQDPYKIIDEFEKLKKKGRVLIGYDALHLAWKQCYFDVSFMLAELPVLPKPAALELCVDTSQEHVSFHPFLYGLLLECLWHEKYGSGNNKKVSVLEKMKNYVSKFPIEKQSRGTNFITYCCSLQKDYCSASRYLIQSIKLNPVKQNVAYLYVKYILTLLRLAFSDDNDDSNLWLNLLGIEWNVD